MPEIIVKLKRGAYPIVVGTDILPCLEPLAAKAIGDIKGARLFVFYDAQVFALHGKALQAVIRRIDHRANEIIIPAGERSKSATALNNIYRFLLSERISRNDFILAVGGGVTSDLVGYAAATTLRGIRWGVVPTTLLGMVDAAIGGKTGINHRYGKNLIGAFWQPEFVFCDTWFLNTLSFRHLVAGLGEVAKYAGLMGSKMIKMMESYLSSDNLYNQQNLAELVALSAAYKARIVAGDEREQGTRMWLNLGHTFAHAIEKSLGYGRLLHGEAVLPGLQAAVELSLHKWPDRNSEFVDYCYLLEELMFLIPKRRIDLKDTLEAMKIDKKRHGLSQKYVLLERPGKPIITSDVEQRAVKKSLQDSLYIYGNKGGRHAQNPDR